MTRSIPAADVDESMEMRFVRAIRIALPLVILRAEPEESPGEAGSSSEARQMRQALRAEILRLRLRMTGRMQGELDNLSITGR
jgi:hypothetical protein